MKMRDRRTLFVAAIALLVGAVVGYLFPHPDATEHDSVALLVDALEQRHINCGGELTVLVSRGVEGDMEPFENGSCPRFDADDVGNFFSFEDNEALLQWLTDAR